MKDKTISIRVDPNYYAWLQNYIQFMNKGRKRRKFHIPDATKSLVFIYGNPEKIAMRFEDESKDYPFKF